MAVNSINSNIAASFAQSNIGVASQNVSLSVSRLSSGNRIVRASDDVAGLSIGTSLRTNLSTLRVARLNTSLGSSLLQVADGALAQITEILQRQKALATQASSGSLTSTERSFLDQEFQALTSEIDRIAGSTNFNGVSLLDGTLSEAASLSDNAATATKGGQSVSFNQTISAGESVRINGVTLIAGTASSGTTFAVGASIAETVENLADRLNDLAKNATYADTLADGIYSATGQTLNISARTGGTLSNNFTVETSQSAATTATGQITTGASGAGTTLTFTLGEGHGFIAGQKIFVSGQADPIDGVTAAQINTSFTIDSVTSTGVTVTSAGTASSGATSTGSVAGVNVTADSAIFASEASLNGGYSGTSFELFGTGFASITSGISADLGIAATPFQNGDAITTTINGTSSTLHTVASGDTLQSIVNGINSNAETTGVKAALTYDGSTYNVRLSLDSVVNNVVVNLGSGYHTGTYGLNGTSIDSTNEIDGAAATAQSRALFNTGFIDLEDAGGTTNILAANAGATVTHATTPAAATPFLEGESLTITINGQEELLHTFGSGESLTDIINSINAKTADTGVYGALTGTDAGFGLRLYVAESSAGTDQVTVNAGATFGLTVNTATKTDTTGATLTQESVVGLSGGLDNGIGLGSTSVTGSVGDNILTSLSQTKANVSVILTENATANDTITVGNKQFVFTGNTAGAPNEILIGSSIAETINNAISTINSYVNDGVAIGTEAYELNQLDITRDGNSIVFTGKTLANVTDIDGDTATVAQSITNASLTNSGDLSNAASTYGVDVSGIANSDFTGKISGFSATYKSTDTADLSVTIGNYTYSAENVDFTVSSNTRIRLVSDTASDGSNGGFFDLQLRAAEIGNFTTQGAADVIASRLDAAFSSLSFRQDRDISSYTGNQSIVSDNVVIGTLVGTSVSAQLDSFDSLKLSNLSVTAPSGSNTDARISLQIDGVEYATTAGIGSSLGANQSYTLVNANDPNQFVTFTTGDTGIDLSTDAKASAFGDALSQAFGVSAGSAALTFQVGSSSADALSVSVSSVRTTSLYEGNALSILTQGSADTASSVLDDAIRSVTSVRAAVGALQSRFNFAAANIESSLQNQDAARGELLDTDIATESTAFAISQVKLQAGISTLAQANQQLQSLLKLIG